MTDLAAAVAASDQLGRTADRYGIAVTLVLHITEEISASLERLHAEAPDHEDGAKRLGMPK